MGQIAMLGIAALTPVLIGADLQLSLPAPGGTPLSHWALAAEATVVAGWGLMKLGHHLAHDHDYEHGAPIGKRSKKQNTVLTIVVVGTLVALVGTALIELWLAQLWNADSAAVSGDVWHNLGDAASAVPMVVTIWMTTARADRAASRVVLWAMLGSAAWVGYEALHMFLEGPSEVDRARTLAVIGTALVPAAIGQVIALVRFFFGNKMNYQPLRDEGEHARSDVLVSVGVAVQAAVAFGMLWVSTRTTGTLAGALHGAAGYVDPVVTLVVAGLIVLGANGIRKELAHPVTELREGVAKARAETDPTRRLEILEAAVLEADRDGLSEREITEASPLTRGAVRALLDSPDPRWSQRLWQRLADAPLRGWRAGEHGPVWTWLHRVAFLLSVALATGISATGVYNGPVLQAGIPGLPENALFVVGFIGNVLGFQVLSKRWATRSERAMIVISLLGTALGYLLMGMVDGTLQYLLVGALLGFVGNAWGHMLGVTGKWIAGNHPRFNGTVTAVFIIGVMLVITQTLHRMEVLVHASLGDATSLGAGMALLAAGLMWLTTPPTKPADARPFGHFEGTGTGGTAASGFARRLPTPLRPLSEPLVRRVAMLLMFGAMSIGVLDGQWRAGIAENRASESLYSWALQGMLGGGLAMLAVALLADLLGRRSGVSPLFLFTMSGAVALAGLAVGIADLAGYAAVGILLAMYLGEGGTTGNQQFAQDVVFTVPGADGRPRGREDATRVLAAISSVRVFGQLLAAVFTMLTVNGAFQPVLNAGWNGGASIPYTFAATGTIYAAWSLWYHHLRRGAGGPAPSPSGSGPSRRSSKLPRVRLLVVIGLVGAAAGAIAAAAVLGVGLLAHIGAAVAVAAWTLLTGLPTADPDGRPVRGPPALHLLGMAGAGLALGALLWLGGEAGAGAAGMTATLPTGSAGEHRAAVRGGFLAGEEPLLVRVLRTALRDGTARPAPTEPGIRLFWVSSNVLRRNDLGRVADHLGGFRLATADGPVIFMTRRTHNQLRSGGQLTELVGLLDGASFHQRRVDELLDRLPARDAAPTAVRLRELAAEVTAMLRDRTDGAVWAHELRKRFELADTGLRDLVWAADGELLASDDGLKVMLAESMREFWLDSDFRVDRAERDGHVMRWANFLRKKVGAHPELAGVPAAELDGIRDYVKTSDPFNKPLRTLEPNGLSEIKPAVRMLISGLNQIPYRGWVSRGVSFGSRQQTARYVARYVPGRTARESQVLSTSKFQGYAATVRFRIFSVTGGNGQLVSNSKLDYEVIFRPGTEFYVLHKRRDWRGRWSIVLVEKTAEGPFAPWPGVSNEVLQQQLLERVVRTGKFRRGNPKGFSEWVDDRMESLPVALVVPLMLILVPAFLALALGVVLPLGVVSMVIDRLVIRPIRALVRDGIRLGWVLVDALHRRTHRTFRPPGRELREVSVLPLTEDQRTALRTALRATPRLSRHRDFGESPAAEERRMSRWVRHPLVRALPGWRVRVVHVGELQRALEAGGMSAGEARRLARGLALALDPGTNTAYLTTEMARATLRHTHGYRTLRRDWWSAFLRDIEHTTSDGSLDALLTRFGRLPSEAAAPGAAVTRSGKARGERASGRSGRAGERAPSTSAYHRGWTDCALCGERHWGRSAAGLLIEHLAPDGTRWVLMQRRTGRVQHGGTWALPGGARHRGETAEQAAVRETSEETGIPTGWYTLTGRSYVDDHGEWSYTWVLASAPERFDVTRLKRSRKGRETAELRWVQVSDVPELHLLPGFRKTWSAAASALLRTGTVVAGVLLISGIATVVPLVAASPARAESGTLGQPAAAPTGSPELLLAAGVLVAGLVVFAVLRMVGGAGSRDPPTGHQMGQHDNGAAPGRHAKPRPKKSRGRHAEPRASLPRWLALAIVAGLVLVMMMSQPADFGLGAALPAPSADHQQRRDGQGLATRATARPRAEAYPRMGIADRFVATFGADPMFADWRRNLAARRAIPGSPPTRPAVQWRSVLVGGLLALAILAGGTWGDAGGAIVVGGDAAGRPGRGVASKGARSPPPGLFRRLVRGLGTLLLAGLALFSAVSPAHAAPAGRELTPPAGYTAGQVAEALDVEFIELNAANGGGFASPGQVIGGRPVSAPADWPGTWTGGGSLWQVYREVFNDPAGYRRAVAADPTPNLIQPDDVHHIQPAPDTPADRRGEAGRNDAEDRSDSGQEGTSGQRDSDQRGAVDRGDGAAESSTETGSGLLGSGLLAGFGAALLGLRSWLRHRAESWQTAYGVLRELRDRLAALARGITDGTGRHRGKPAATRAGLPPAATLDGPTAATLSRLLAVQDWLDVQGAPDRVSGELLIAIGNVAHRPSAASRLLADLFAALRAAERSEGAVVRAVEVLNDRHGFGWDADTRRGLRAVLVNVSAADLAVAGLAPPSTAERLGRLVRGPAGLLLGGAALLGAALWAVAALTGWAPGLKNALSLVGGALVGLVMGVFGAGGGLTAGPYLDYLLGQTLVQAATGGTAIVGAAALVKSLVKIRADRRPGAPTDTRLDWGTALAIGLLGVPPATSGGLFTLPTLAVQLGLVGLLGLAAIRTLGIGTAGSAPNNALAKHFRTARIGLGAGLLTGLFGISGAFLLVPSLVAAGLSPNSERAGESVLVVTVITSTASLIAKHDQLPGLDWALIAPFAVVAVLASLRAAPVKAWLKSQPALAGGLDRGFAAFLVVMAGITLFQVLASMLPPLVAAVGLVGGAGVTALVMPGVRGALGGAGARSPPRHARPAAPSRPARGLGMRVLVVAGLVLLVLLGADTAASAAAMIGPAAQSDELAGHVAAGRLTAEDAAALRRRSAGANETALLRAARAAVPGVDPTDPHAGYLPELNPVNGLPVRVSLLGDEPLDRAQLDALKAAAAASRPVRVLGRAGLAAWAGVAESELPAGLRGVLVMGGLADRLVYQALSEKHTAPDDLVYALIGGWGVLDEITHRAFEQATLEQRQRFYLLADRAGPVEAPAGLRALLAARATARPVVEELLDRRGGSKKVAGLAAPEALTVNRWFGRNADTAWALDPTVVGAGFAPAIANDRLLLMTPRRAGERPLALVGWASTRYGGLVGTLLHRVRGVSALLAHGRFGGAALVIGLLGLSLLGGGVDAGVAPQPAAAGALWVPRSGLPVAGLHGLVETKALALAKVYIFNRPRIVKARTAERDLAALLGRPELVFKHAHEQRALIRSVTTAAGHRVAGAPVVRTGFAVARDRTVDLDWNIVYLEPAETVVVTSFAEGGPSDPAGELGDRLARQGGITWLLNDFDGLRRQNLRGGYRLDTAAGLLEQDPGELFVKMWLTVPDIAGRLTEQDVLAQFADLLEQRERLLLVAPNKQLLHMLAGRLDWVERIVQAGALPEDLAETVRFKHSEFLRVRPTYQRPAEGFRLPAPSVADTEAFLATFRAEGQLREVDNQKLRELVEQGRRVWAHDHLLRRGRWLVTVGAAAAVLLGSLALAASMADGPALAAVAANRKLDAALEAATALRDGGPGDGALSTRPLSRAQTEAIAGALRRHLTELPDPASDVGAVTLPWAEWAPVFADLGLPNLDRELIRFTVFDGHSRAWVVGFDHFPTVLADRQVPAQTRYYLDLLVMRHEEGHLFGASEHEGDRAEVAGLVADALAGEAVDIPVTWWANRKSLRVALDFVRAHPQGVTAGQLAEFLGATLQTAQDRLRVLFQAGALRRTGSEGRGYVHFLRPGVRALLRELAVPGTGGLVLPGELGTELVALLNRPPARAPNAPKTRRLGELLNAVGLTEQRPSEHTARTAAKPTERAPIKRTEGIAAQRLARVARDRRTDPLLDALRDSPAGGTVAELAELAGLDPDGTRKRLAALVDREQLVISGWRPGLVREPVYQLPRRGGEDRGPGGPARDSHRPVTEEQAEALRGWLHPSLAMAVLTRGELARLRRVSRSAVRQVFGVALIEDLAARSAGVGGPDDLRAFTVGGWIYLDVHTYRTLPEADLLVLLAHEELHARYPDWTEEQVAARAPLPEFRDGEVVHRDLPPTGARGRHSGSLIIGDWEPGAPELFDGWLAERYPVEPGDLNAPPEWLVIQLTQEVEAWLAEYELSDLPGRLLGRYVAGLHRIAVFAPIKAALDASGLTARVRAHEEQLHWLGRERTELGLHHEEDTAAVTALLTLAEAVGELARAGELLRAGLLKQAATRLAQAGYEIDRAGEPLDGPLARDQLLRDWVVTARADAEALVTALLQAPGAAGLLWSLGYDIRRELTIVDPTGHAELTPAELAERASELLELVTEAAELHPALGFDREAGLVRISSGWRPTELPIIGMASSGAADPGEPLLPVELFGSLGRLTFQSARWFVGANPELADATGRSALLTDLARRALRARSTPLYADDRLAVYRVAVDPPAGGLLLDHVDNPVDQLELTLHRIDGRWRVANLYPVGTGTPVRLPTLPTGSLLPVVAPASAPRRSGVGWAPGPDQVLTAWTALPGRPGDPSRLTGLVAGAAVTDWLAPTLASYRDMIVPASRAADLLAAVRVDDPIALPDLLVLHTPGQHADPLRLAEAGPRAGDRVFVVIWAGDEGPLVVLPAQVENAGAVSFLLAAPLTGVDRGAPVLDAEGRVVGMVSHVDLNAGAVALPVELLRPAVAEASTKAWGDASATLRRAATRLTRAAALASNQEIPRARAELLRVANALDLAAAQLGPLATSRLSEADYHRVFGLLIALGQQWQTQLMRNGVGNPAPDGSYRRVEPLGISLRAALPGSYLDLDVAALGRPGDWALHTIYRYRPAEFADTYRTHAAGQPVPTTPGELALVAERAHRAVGALVKQLPNEQADRLDAPLLHWIQPNAPPAGIAALLTAELPERVPQLTEPARRAAAHHLRMLLTGGAAVAVALLAAGLLAAPEGGAALAAALAGPGPRGAEPAKTADEALDKRLNRLRFAMFASRNATFLWMQLTGFIAVTHFGASAFQAGLFTVVTSSVDLLWTLYAGELLERRSKRSALLIAELGRLALTASIPVAALLGWFTIWQLYAVVAGQWMLMVLSSNAVNTYLNELTARDEKRQTETRTKLQAESSVAQAAETVVGGVLTSIAGPVAPVAASATLFAVGAGALRGLPDTKPRAGKKERGDKGAGFRYLRANPVQQALTRSTATLALLGAGNSASVGFYLLDTLGAAELMASGISVLAGLSMATGAMLAGRLKKRGIGEPVILGWALLLPGPLYLLMPLASSFGGSLFVAIALSTSSAVMGVVGNIANDYRQKRTPKHLSSRVNAAAVWKQRAGTPVVAFATSASVAAFGHTVPMIAIAVLGWSAGLWVVLSPLRGARTFEEAEQAARLRGPPSVRAAVHFHRSHPGPRNLLRNTAISLAAALAALLPAPGTADPRNQARSGPTSASETRPGGSRSGTTADRERASIAGPVRQSRADHWARRLLSDERPRAEAPRGLARWLARILFVLTAAVMLLLVNASPAVGFSWSGLDPIRSIPPPSWVTVMIPLALGAAVWLAASWYWRAEVRGWQAGISDRELRSAGRAALGELARGARAEGGLRNLNQRVVLRRLSPAAAPDTGGPPTPPGAGPPGVGDPDPARDQPGAEPLGLPASDRALKSDAAVPTKNDVGNPTRGPPPRQSGRPPLEGGAS